MNYTEHRPTLIEKENIRGLKFNYGKGIDQSDNLRLKLDRAMRLGNALHSKVKIYFEDKEMIYVVETTIWAVGDRNIVLKQGITIPIASIHDVEYL